MNRINIPNSSYADCPIRMILSRISDKWSILTLFTLTQAPVMRFNELQKTIPDISQKMLTVTLRAIAQACPTLPKKWQNQAMSSEKPCV